MKPTNLPPQLSSAHLSTGIRVIQKSSRSLPPRLGLILILAGLLLSGVYSSSSASRSSQTNKKGSSDVALNKALATTGSLGMAERKLPASRPAFNPVPMPLPPVGETIEVFAAGCTTPQTNFVVGDTVCVKVSGVPLSPFFPRRLTWATTDTTIVRSTDIT